MVDAFARNGIEVDDWVVALDSAGARVVGD
jgi:hypothetical protein